MEKLAIFDLDGTLFRTEKVNYYSYIQALEPYGKTIEYEYFVKECNGKKYTEFLSQLVSSKQMEQVHNKKKEIYANNLKYATANIHLFDLIQAIKNDHYCAIVTTASKKNTLEILQYFKYEHLFDLILTQEDVARVKPDPQGFIIAMEKYNIKPENTLIFEDSIDGINAARSTGAAVFIVDKF